MGSTSDLPVMKQAAEFLNDMEIPFEINALSAHRVPEQVAEFAKGAHKRGVKVIIAGAGGAAHLPGAAPRPGPQPGVFARTGVGLAVSRRHPYGRRSHSQLTREDRAGLGPPPPDRDRARLGLSLRRLTPCSTPSAGASPSPLSC